MKALKQNKGITLIALIITIIVMLILVAITINISVNGGLFGYAKNASEETNSAVQNEKDLGAVEDGLSIGQLISKYTDTIEYVWTTEGDLATIDSATLQVYKSTYGINTIMDATQALFTQEFTEAGFNPNGLIDSSQGMTYRHFGYNTLKKYSAGKLINTLTQTGGNITQVEITEFYKNGVLVLDLSSELEEGTYTYKKYSYYEKDGTKVDIFSHEDVCYYLPDINMTCGEFNSYYGNSLDMRYYDDSPSSYWKFKDEYSNKKISDFKVENGYPYQCNDNTFTESWN